MSKCVYREKIIGITYCRLYQEEISLCPIKCPYFSDKGSDKGSDKDSDKDSTTVIIFEE